MEFKNSFMVSMKIEVKIMNIFAILFCLFIDIQLIINVIIQGRGGLGLAIFVIIAMIWFTYICILQLHTLQEVIVDDKCIVIKKLFKREEISWSRIFKAEEVRTKAFIDYYIGKKLNIFFDEKVIYLNNHMTNYEKLLNLLEKKEKLYKRIER